MTPTPHFTFKTVPAFRVHLIGLAGLGALVMGSSAPALAQSGPSTATSPWTVSVDVGVSNGPEYMGGKDRDSAPFLNPMVEYATDNYGSFSLSGGGLTWMVLVTPTYGLGLSVGRDGGRDEADGDRIAGSRRTSLTGLGDIDSTTELGVTGFVELSGLTFSASILRSTSKTKGHGGTHGSLSVSVPIPISDSFSLSVAPNLAWGDARYNQSYFGVNSTQAARSGLRAFTAKSGIVSYGLDIEAAYPIDKQWSAFGIVSVQRLANRVANSPVVKSKSQSSVVAGVRYAF